MTSGPHENVYDLNRLPCFTLMGGPVSVMAPFRRDSLVHGIVSRGNQGSDLDLVVLGRGQGGLQNAMSRGAR